MKRRSVRSGTAEVPVPSMVSSATLLGVRARVRVRSRSRVRVGFRLREP